MAAARGRIAARERLSTAPWRRALCRPLSRPHERPFRHWRHLPHYY